MVKIYTQSNCPKCRILKSKMEEKNIEYFECDNLKEMQQKNILYIPVLEVEGNLLGFSEALNWIGGQG